MNKFNLIEEKWIPCVRISNGSQSETERKEIEELSLRDVLLEAGQIEEIIGDNPLVTITLHRLLLAILHCSFRGPKNYDEWAAMWNNKVWDTELVRKYLDRNLPNFNLFDDERPFYQTSTLELKEKYLKPVLKFFFEGETPAVLFDHSSKEKPLILCPKRAARLLIAFQSFDVGGLQTREEEKDKSAYAAHLNKSAVGLVRGESLFATLMLNLCRYDPRNNYPFSFDEKNDLPVWERKLSTKSEEKKLDGYIDLLTWQNRRVRLQPMETEDGRIVVEKVVSMKGTMFPEDYTLKDKELMVAFKKDTDKKNKSGFKPIGFEKHKALWRDSFSLFQSVKEDLRPKILNWLDELVAEKKLNKDAVFPMDFFGLNVRRADPLFWRHERLPLPLVYLKDKELCFQLRDALRLAEIVAILLSKSVHRLAMLHYLSDSHLEPKISNWFKPALRKEEKLRAEDAQKKFEKTSNRDKDIVSFRKTLAPELRYWSRLESDFRALLISLKDEPEAWANHRQEWVEVLRDTVWQAFDEVTFSLGNSAHALRSTSIAREWLRIEFAIRKEKYVASEEFDDEAATETNQEDESDAN